MSELKPCPFCGGKAELWKAIVSYDYNVCRYRCGCKKCSISASGSRKRAIDLWNTRTQKEVNNNGR